MPSLVLVSVLSVAILRVSPSVTLFLTNLSLVYACAAFWPRPGPCCRKYVPDMSQLIASFSGNETHPKNSLRLRQKENNDYKTFLLLLLIEMKIFDLSLLHNKFQIIH